MTEPIFQYVQSSRTPGAPLIAMQKDVEYMVVERVGAFAVEYGVKGRELAIELHKNAEEFIRAMELQGLTLITGLKDPRTGQPLGNPQVVTDKQGVPYATFSVHNDLDRNALPDEIVDAKTGGQGTPTQKEPRSLDDSGGLVDYRIIGVFWAPKVSIEIATAREDRLAKERAAKNPTTWGGGSSTPNRPSLPR